MGGGSSLPSTQDLGVGIDFSRGLARLPGSTTPVIFNPNAELEARTGLKKQITDSDKLDELYKRELLSMFDKTFSNSEIGNKFAAAVDPEGGIFKEFAAKKDRIKLAMETPGLAKQTLLGGNLATQSTGLLGERT